MLNSQAEELPQETSQELPEESDDLYPLTPKQESALRALVTHPTIKEAALAAGVSEATLWRYRRDPTFARRLCEARREVRSHTDQYMHHASLDAARALHEIVKDPQAPPAARISAARTILDQSRRAIEVDELGARLEEFEQFTLRRQEEDALADAAEEGEA